MHLEHEKHIIFKLETPTEQQYYSIGIREYHAKTKTNIDGI